MHGLFPLPGTPPFPYYGQEPNCEQGWSSEWRVANLEDSEAGGKSLRWEGQVGLRRTTPGIHRLHGEFELYYQRKTSNFKLQNWGTIGFAFLKDVLFWEQVTGGRAALGTVGTQSRWWFVLRALYMTDNALDVFELTLPHSVWLGWTGFVGVLQRTSSDNRSEEPCTGGWRLWGACLETPNNLIIVWLDVRMGQWNMPGA